MRWSLHVGDILDVPADVLVCSANVHLNLSGGVGGAFTLRHGPAMQEALRGYLARNGLHFVRRGEIIEMPPCGSPYSAVFHAVGVDAAYETSSEIVAAVLSESLRRSAALQARTVSLTAVGTGYGRLTLPQFAEGMRLVISQDHPPIEIAILGLRSRHDADWLRQSIPELGNA